MLVVISCCGHRCWQDIYCTYKSRQNQGKGKKDEDIYRTDDGSTKANNESMCPGIRELNLEGDACQRTDKNLHAAMQAENEA